MKHETAWNLVCEHAPDQAGMLWNTTDADGCDTANAVANQYADDEVEDAIRDLKWLASGVVPRDWKPGAVAVAR